MHALLGRIRPGRLRMALQPRLSSFDGRTLLGAAERVGDVEFRKVDERRTMHGKLVEWVDRNGTVALWAVPT